MWGMGGRVLLIICFSKAALGLHCPVPGRSGTQDSTAHQSIGLWPNPQNLAGSCVPIPER